MPKPVNEEEVNFNEGTETLSEDFLHELEYLKEKIYAKTSPKLFEGVSFDSRMFLNAINCLIDVFNSQKPLFVNEMVEIVFMEEVDMLLSDGKEFYNDLFLKAFPDFQDMEPIPASELLQQMKLIRQNTFENFTLPPQIKIKMSQEFTECFESLQNYVRNSERIFLEKNEEKCQIWDNQFADELVQAFTEEVDKHPVNELKKQVDFLSALIEKISKNFVEEAMSEQKTTILSRIVSNMSRQSFEKILARQKSLSPDEMTKESEFKDQNQLMEQKILEAKKIF